MTNQNFVVTVTTFFFTSKGLIFWAHSSPYNRKNIEPLVKIDQEAKWLGV